MPRVKSTVTNRGWVTNLRSLLSDGQHFSLATQSAIDKLTKIASNAPRQSFKEELVRCLRISLVHPGNDEYAFNIIRLIAKAFGDAYSKPCRNSAPVIQHENARNPTSLDIPSATHVLTRRMATRSMDGDAQHPHNESYADGKTNKMKKINRRDDMQFRLKTETLNLLMDQIIEALELSETELRTRACDSLSIVLNESNLAAEAMNRNDSRVSAEDDESSHTSPLPLLKKISEALCKRMLDCSWKVQMSAVLAAEQLQGINEGKNQVVQTFKDKLIRCPFTNVRLQVLKSLTIYFHTIPQIVERLMDADVSIRLQVLDILLQKTNFDDIGIEQRLGVIRFGISQSGARKQEEVAKKFGSLIDVWLQIHDYNIPEFIGFFDVISNTSLVEDLVKYLIDRYGISNCSSRFIDSELNQWFDPSTRLVEPSKLTPEMTFVWHQLVAYTLVICKCAITKETVMDMLMAEPVDFLKYISINVLSMYDAGTRVFDLAGHLFTYEKLLDLVITLDVTEEITRKMGLDLALRLIYHVDYPPESYKRIAAIYYHMTLSPREHLSQVSSVLVNLMPAKPKDHRLKTSFDAFLASRALDNIDNQYKAIWLMCETVQYMKIQPANTVIKTLYADVVIPSLTSLAKKVRRVAFMTLGRLCCFDKKFAYVNIPLLTNAVILDDVKVSREALKALFDLAIQHRLPLGHVSEGQDFGTLYNLLMRLLFEDKFLSKGLRSTAATGLMKLFGVGASKSPILMAHLLSLATYDRYHKVVVDLKHSLMMFFAWFTGSMPIGKSIMIAALIRAVSETARLPPTEAGRPDPQNLINMITLVSKASFQKSNDPLNPRSYENFMYSLCKALIESIQEHGLYHGKPDLIVNLLKNFPYCELLPLHKEAIAKKLSDAGSYLKEELSLIKIVCKLRRLSTSPSRHTSHQSSQK